MRVRSISLVLGLLAVGAFFAPAADRAEAQTPESGRYVFDLGSPDSTVEEHTARITWHLMADDLATDARADSVWYSVYLVGDSRMGGRVVVDLDTGVVSGEITEEWICLGCPGWRSYDTSLTATVTGGTVTAAGDGWTIAGKVNVRYRAEGSADETPSICGTEECYNCRQRICSLSVGQQATTKLTGRFQGDTLHLAFADRLAADPATMDVSPLADTEYFMSRFSTTVTGAVVDGDDEAGQGSAAAATPTSTIASAGIPAPSLGAEPLPGPDDPGEPEARDDSTGGEVDAPASQAQPADPATTERGAGWLIAIVVLSLVGAGAVGLVIGLIVRFRMGWSLKEAAADSAADLGVSVSADAEGGVTGAIGEAGRELTGGAPDYTALSPSASGAPPPTEPATPTPPGGAAPSTPPPPPPPPPPVGGTAFGTAAKTPSEYYSSRPGVKPGGYRYLEFPDGARLWRPGKGEVDGKPAVDLLTSQLIGPVLIGEPDPGFPGYSPAYDNAGKRIGWVLTTDLPG